MIPGTEYRDHYGNIHPDDSELWLNLFILADKTNPELAAVLMYLRNTGCVLIPNREYGYIIRPVIGEDGWESEAVYNQEKGYLKQHYKIVVGLLKELAGGR